jgi:hypothetical protein
MAIYKTHLQLLFTMNQIVAAIYFFSGPAVGDNPDGSRKHQSNR